MADGCYTIRNLDARQACAAEGSVVDGRELAISSKANVGQVWAVGEGRAADGGNCVRDLDARQACAAEGRVADSFQLAALIECYVCQSRAAEEGRVADGGHACRNINARQARAVPEGARADRSQLAVRFELNGGQRCAVVEGICADGCHTGRNVNACYGCATPKYTLTNGCNCARNCNFCCQFAVNIKYCSIGAWIASTHIIGFECNLTPLINRTVVIHSFKIGATVEYRGAETCDAVGYCNGCQTCAIIECFGMNNRGPIENYGVGKLCAILVCIIRNGR